MSDININSGYIKVFPSTNRLVTTDDSARFPTETNLINLVNRLTGYGSFVITSSYTANSSFEFNIGGYYFKITDVSNLVTLFTTLTDIYAKLILDSGIIKGDTDEAYEGLTFTDTEPSSGTYLHLLTRTDTTSTWYIPDDGKLNRIISIDGGIL